jgi:hypothetical protein
MPAVDRHGISDLSFFLMSRQNLDMYNSDKHKILADEFLLDLEIKSRKLKLVLSALYNDLVTKIAEHELSRVG